MTNTEVTPAWVKPGQPVLYKGSTFGRIERLNREGSAEVWVRWDSAAPDGWVDVSELRPRRTP